MQFEPEYYNKLSDFFNTKDGITYNLEDLTDDPERFIFHVKNYIDNTVGDMVHVEFSNDYKKIRVLEFFESRTPKPAIAPVKKNAKGLFN
jgi:hypothetical protein